ncbi:MULTISPECIES: type I restriction-modification system subunit M [unclassified Streptococcus]|uniref:type I restriction-modification system subunit M n=1 Tax=unclassified Streptococcus TaxID=2608887 RepID=UPI0010724619|nr:MULTISPECIES: type I restriction-modification system subunit M [unclassified Streptococcus]MBF0805929.1 type I restriction-modification system subunit M [Streptococcus sp. 19428wA2_WM07]TFU28502.1 type I restriction-modification system subunit M [Streptococcus sp. WM07]
MATTNEITSKLWEMANKLRGTMDASEYKDYILPFMFYRYLSEHQREFLEVNHLEDFYSVTDQAEREEYLEEISRSLGYAILSEYSWDSLVSKIETHQIKASDFQDMFESFYENAKRNPMAEADFATVFADVNLGNARLGGTTNERAKSLNELVLLVNDFDFKDDSGHDVLGDVYEYLIGQFAANAGKKGGEFYTPHEVSQILAKLVTMDKKVTSDQFRVYDPTMGSGSLLLTVQKEFPDGDKEGSVRFCGQEMNRTTYNLARMNLMMHGVSYKNMDLRCADTLELPWPIREEGGIEVPQHFDAVVANPPYSQSWNIKDINRDKDPRFKGFGIAPASKADYAFVLHGLYHLDRAGTMAIVLPHGVLFRGAAERKIRKNLVDENLLDAVIGLPANLFYGTSIPTCILVFKGRQARGERKDVLFIDASREFEKSKNKNTLTSENIEKIVETYRNRVDVDKYAHLASLEEIQENDYNLNIPRYVDTFEEEEVTALPDLAKELQEVRQEISKTSTEFFSMVNQLVGTSEELQKDLQEFIDLMK